MLRVGQICFPCLHAFQDSGFALYTEILLVAVQIGAKPHQTFRFVGHIIVGNHIHFCETGILVDHYNRSLDEIVLLIGIGKISWKYWFSFDGIKISDIVEGSLAPRAASLEF